MFGSGQMSEVVILLVLSASLLAFSLADHSIVNHLSSMKHQTLCHDHEKLALLHFKHSFSIACELAYHPTYAYPKVKFWNESDDADCCRWLGVKCERSTGHVIGLDLSNSCLYGNLPSNSTVFDLDHLLELNLAGNNFNYSQIPRAFARLPKLRSLNLSDSFLSGQIPSELSQLSTLSHLDLSSQPDQTFECQSHLILHEPSMGSLIQNFTHLAQLDLSCVDISSTVLHLLNNMTTLKALVLQKCNLYGKFPLSILQLPNIEVVDLSFNEKLEGYLPKFQSNNSLRVLRVAQTKFYGELPLSLAKLGHLRILDLLGSHFFGRIPSSLGNLTQLTYLDLGDNTFVNGIPSSLTNLTQLDFLGLSGLNAKPVELNSWLPRLHKIKQLTLSNMNLGGEIPECLRNLTGLTLLALRNNQLIGKLPNWLANMTQLTGLGLDGNRLQGDLPPWLPRLVNLQGLALQYHNSTGAFEPFLKLKNLQALSLEGISLTFSPITSTNTTSVPMLHLLTLKSCNLTEFPLFLHNQSGLQYLSFSGNNITGNIPQWFVNITKESLLLLDLSYNSLRGFEETPSFLPWSNLGYLNFTGNKFRGRLPSPPSTLAAYLVSHNQFHGVIPMQLCDASALIFLDLSNNNMSGQIPHCIGHLGSLLVLNLLGNNFSGKFPQTLSRSCQMKMINLSKNRIEGKLPMSLTNCRMLEVLDIGANQIQDGFPSWLGSLPKLEVLVLNHNKLNGSIASSNTSNDFRCLRIIDISHNYFTGSLPYSYIQSWKAMAVSKEGRADSSNSKNTLSLWIRDSVFTADERIDYSITLTNKGHETFYSKILTVFRVIDFSSNKFTGPIPGVIGKLKGLQALNLSNNNLDGKIPSSLAKITDLESLDLSQNRLKGEIPQQLTQLPFLAIFNVSHNCLKGPIPQGEQFNSFTDSSSFDGNLALCGFPLSKKCHNVDTLPSPATQESDKQEDDPELIYWVFRACGCASGLIVGFILSKTYITDRYHEWFVDTFVRNNKRPKTRAMGQLGQ